MDKIEVGIKIFALSGILLSLIGIIIITSIQELVEWIKKRQIIND